LTALSHHQSHVCTDCVCDTITHLL